MSHDEYIEKEQRAKSGRRAAHSSLITFEDLAKYFHLPITKVAGELGVCTTVLKKVCRRNGIPRWPHRKLRAIDKMIDTAEKKLNKKISSQGGRAQLELEIEQLRAKRANILRNPTLISGSGHSNGRPVMRVPPAVSPAPHGQLLQQRRSRRQPVNKAFDMSGSNRAPTLLTTHDDDSETLEAAKILGSLMHDAEAVLDTLETTATVPLQIYDANRAPAGTAVPTLVFNHNVRPRTEVRQSLQDQTLPSAFQPSSTTTTTTNSSPQVVTVQYGAVPQQVKTMANARTLLPNFIHHHHHHHHQQQHY